jgi:hypothetical protein
MISGLLRPSRLGPDRQTGVDRSVRWAARTATSYRTRGDDGHARETTNQQRFIDGDHRGRSKSTQSSSVDVLDYWRRGFTWILRRSAHGKQRTGWRRTWFLPPWPSAGKSAGSLFQGQLYVCTGPRPICRGVQRTWSPEWSDTSAPGPLTYDRSNERTSFLLLSFNFSCDLYQIWEISASATEYDLFWVPELYKQNL